MATLNFIIVGPGIMPIPPSGWGACEILIWDYACELRKLGHQVEIVNTKNMSDVIHTICEKKPDVVHIQYDDHAHIVPEIVEHSKLVLLTSHFGYLEQVHRWGGYSHIFHNMIRYSYPNYYHFALSDGIANVYKQHGVDMAHIVVTPNGARSELFRYTDKPAFPDRSIVVGKIESRKGQHRLQHHSDIWFAGNRCDNLFDYSNPRWLGEWDKNTLYQNLTDYGNLVLMSDGEADPLVVKEALMSGLGVVVSEYAAANLDTSLPFITVIPATRMSDDSYVHSEIVLNRERSIQMRNQIREYGMQFDWSRLVQKYVEKISALMVNDTPLCQIKERTMSDVSSMGAYFQCYKNPYATYKILESFRKYYPDSTVVMLSDNGYDYTEMANYFNCIYIHSPSNVPLIYNSIEEIDKMENGAHVLWANQLIDRLHMCFSKIKEDYVVWLEDDVLMNRVMAGPFSCDINGFNPNRFWKSMCDALSKIYKHIQPDGVYTWSGGGGSIYNKSAMLSYFEKRDTLNDIIIHWRSYQLTSNIAFDFLLSLLTHIHGGTVGLYRGTGDGLRDTIDYSLENQHQYKHYYGVPMPVELSHLVSTNK